MSADRKVFAFSRYMAAQSEKRTAYAELNYYGAKLELAQIKERLAEIESQHEPLAKLTEDNAAIREQCIQAAHFVVFGRFLP